MLINSKSQWLVNNFELFIPVKPHMLHHNVVIKPLLFQVMQIRNGFDHTLVVKVTFRRGFQKISICKPLELRKVLLYTRPQSSSTEDWRAIQVEHILLAVLLVDLAHRFVQFRLFAEIYHPEFTLRRTQIFQTENPKVLHYVGVTFRGVTFWFYVENTPQVAVDLLFQVVISFCVGCHLLVQ